MELKEAMRKKIIHEGIPVIIQNDHPSTVMISSEDTGVSYQQSISYPVKMSFILVSDADEKLYALSTSSEENIALRGYTGWKCGYDSIQKICKDFWGRTATFINPSQYLYWKEKWSTYLDKGEYWVNKKEESSFSNECEQAFYKLVFSRNGELWFKCLEDFNMNIRTAEYGIRPVVELLTNITWEITNDGIVVQL